MLAAKPPRHLQALQGSASFASVPAADLARQHFEWAQELESVVPWLNLLIELMKEKVSSGSRCHARIRSKLI